MIWIYDAEVFNHNWLFVFKSYQSGEYKIIIDDGDELKSFINQDDIYVGFNSKHYDQFIVKACACGLNNQQVKEVNDFIVRGGQGWDCPLLENLFFRFNNVDVKDDMQQGLSLKAIEGHQGMDIRETTVPFDLDRPLTQAELDETIFYCKHDVDSTEQVFKLRLNYFKNKIQIGRMAGLDDVKAMGMTNAKLTAALLKATPRKHDDERKYVYPTNLLREYIPQEVFDFFDRMYNPLIPDEVLFKQKLKFYIGDCLVTIGYGGIHGAIPNYFFEEGLVQGVLRILVNNDVGSYYPHLMVLYGYTSRNIPSPRIYEDILETRMRAKATGDTATNYALKLVANTKYGAMLNRYNDLYDPLMGRSVCITGQLFLLELAEHCYQTIPNIRIPQLNTDGIMLECDASDYEKVDALMREWQERTKFTLEEDKIERIAQKDVNNYVEIQKGGKAKAKGGYLVKGIAPAGAFNINNSCCIVATALKEYLIHGTPVEETINTCEDIFQFQIIAKAGAKYKEAYHVVDGIKYPVQKVNRVYATRDERYGKIFKVKADTDSEARIDSLPEHCIIDNDNHLTICDVDKQFYIDMANKRVNDFKGIKPEKKGRTRKMDKLKSGNIYKRLMAVRRAFLEHGIQKTGKNATLKSMYFQLDDIVPVATPLFEAQDLLPVTNFTKDECTLTIVDMNDNDNMLVFTAPMREWNGNAAVTPVQALGATITYMRRYLYQIALDIVEVDEIESGITPTQVGQAPAQTAPKPLHLKENKSSAPATAATREEVTKQLTNTNGNATDVQITSLKAALKKLLELDKSKEVVVNQIAVQTKSFTQISAKDCEALLTKIGTMIEGAGK